ncbi:TolC family protein [Sinimarinibacterium thermocellulolyticum]|uniref:TolC family protein n=1 Tax=Sinimarinibacterium thermocellulolyticum TaxID=3170016 RepID=A0ABV2A8Q4_9GAMM
MKPARLIAIVVGLLALPAHADELLERYVAEALAANPALQARDAAARESAQTAAAARARRLPSLALDARYTAASGGRTIDIPTGDLLNGVYATLNRFLAERGEPPVFPQIENQSIALLRKTEQETKLRLTAPLYAPALWANAEAQAARHGARVAEHEAFARVLVREVKRAYYGAIQAEAAERILDASVALLAEDVRVSQALVEAGKATRDRVLRAEAERLAVQQRRDEAAVLAEQARRRLNILRDRPADAPLSLPAPSALPRPDTLAPARARPELRQLDRAIDAADAGVRAARAARAPTLALAADYGIQGERYRVEAEDDFGTVSLLLNWSLFDFGQRRAEALAASAEAEQLRAQRRDLDHQLDLARWSAEAQLDTARRAIDAAEARLAAAEEVFRIAERKRAAASLAQIEFLDAQRALTEARLNVAIARCTALDRAAELELASASYPLPAAAVAGTPE